MAGTKKVLEVVAELPVPEEAKKRGRPKGSVKTIKNDRDKISRAKAIRLQCEECMGFQIFMIKDCPAPSCPLWPFRMGRGQEHTDAPIHGKDYVRPRDKR